MDQSAGAAAAGVPLTAALLLKVVCDKLRDDLPRVMIGSLGFWGPVNFCNFYW